MRKKKIEILKGRGVKKWKEGKSEENRTLPKGGDQIGKDTASVLFAKKDHNFRRECLLRKVLLRSSGNTTGRKEGVDSDMSATVPGKKKVTDVRRN